MSCCSATTCRSHKEVALKDYALSRGRLLMGPGAGTAMLGGVGLGFANAVRPGPVGVVAAAGTGAQEAMALLDRWGVGVSQVIGVGGRDLSTEVGGRMARAAVSALRERPGDGGHPLRLQATFARSGCLGARDRRREADWSRAFLGLDPQFPAPAGVVLADTLESGVTATLDVLGIAAPDTTATIGPTLAEVRSRLAPGRRLIRGLFSGGTLCYESLVILGRTVGEVHSNTPINKAWGLPAPADSHQCLDLGEEEYTRGRPHPMIDPEARLELLARARGRPAGRGDHPRCRPRPRSRRGPRARPSPRRVSPRWPMVAPRSSPTCSAPTRTRRATRHSAIDWYELGAS